MGEQGGVNMSQGGRGGGGRGLDPIAADERFGPDPSKNISEIVEDRRRASRVLTIAPPASGHAIGRSVTEPVPVWPLRTERGMSPNLSIATGPVDDTCMSYAHCIIQLYNFTDTAHPSRILTHILSHMCFPVPHQPRA